MNTFTETSTPLKVMTAMEDYTTTNNSFDYLDSVDYEVPEDDEDYKYPPGEKRGSVTSRNRRASFQAIGQRRKSFQAGELLNNNQRSMNLAMLNADIMGASSTCLADIVDDDDVNQASSAAMIFDHNHNNDPPPQQNNSNSSIQHSIPNLNAIQEQSQNEKEEVVHDSFGTYATEKESEVEHTDDKISIRSIHSDYDDVESFAGDSFYDDDEESEDEYELQGSNLSEESSEIVVEAMIAAAADEEEKRLEQPQQRRRSSGGMDSSLHYEVPNSSEALHLLANKSNEKKTISFELPSSMQNESFPNPLEKKESSHDGNRAKKNWKQSLHRLLITSAATARVSLDNKIGIPASELNETNPLRFIAMSIQRSIRYYEQVRNPSKYEGLETASFDAETNTVTFPPTQANARNGKEYRLAQPAFRCEEYNSNDFQKIRKAFNISDRQYHAVLNLEDVRVETSFNVIEAKEASGKSGSFFFLSPDQRYILKSCTKADVKTLIRILPHYQKYVEQSSQSKEGAAYGTLLPRYLGLYTLTYPDNDNIPDTTIVVMTNFFAGSHKIHYKFDLKGSTYKRTASAKERQKKSPVYKDIDWIDMGKKLTFPEERVTQSIKKQLELDTEFLSKLHLIDYSLLVGIHDHVVSSKSTHDCLDREREESMGVIFSSSKVTKEIRYFGIVDILTPYKAKKRMETVFTGTMIGRHDISCQPPKKYAKRFCQFMNNHVLETEMDSRRSVTDKGLPIRKLSDHMKKWNN